MPSTTRRSRTVNEQLHLLRGIPPHIDGRPVDFAAFKRLVDRWSKEPDTVFGSWTRNRPRREPELEGGSVYFVHKRKTVFRMPFLGIEPVRDFAPDAGPRFINQVAICCAPEIVMVERYPVRFLRGWRYLRGVDAPPDLPAESGNDARNMPPNMRRELEEAGLL